MLHSNKPSVTDQKNRQVHKEKGKNCGRSVTGTGNSLYNTRPKHL